MSKSKLPAMLLIVVMPILACQFLRPAAAHCRVKMPAVGWVEHSDGDEISFAIEGMDWKATVDCDSGRLVEGQPVRPAHAREMMIPVEDSSYRLITSDPNISMSEDHQHGSQIRIDAGDTYYVAVLSAFPGNLGSAIVRYFMGGQTDEGMVHMYCFSLTEGEKHISMPVMTSQWTVSEPVTVSLVCSGRNFILELSTEISQRMLRQGPTETATPPIPTLTPIPPGFHSGQPTDA